MNSESHGIINNDSHGISIYFPQTSGEYDSSYETLIDFTSDHSWDEFLCTFHNGSLQGDVYEPDDEYTHANHIISGFPQSIAWILGMRWRPLDGRHQIRPRRTAQNDIIPRGKSHHQFGKKDVGRSLRKPGFGIRLM